MVRSPKPGTQAAFRQAATGLPDGATAGYRLCVAQRGGATKLRGDLPTWVFGRSSFQQTIPEIFWGGAERGEEKIRQAVGPLRIFTTRAADIYQQPDWITANFAGASGCTMETRAVIHQIPGVLQTIGYGGPSDRPASGPVY